MAKQSVLGAPKAPQGQGSRTGFSMSQNFTFTAGVGMILPVYKQFLNLGETVTGAPSFFARTEPLLAPAMADFDVYLDVFFVPMRHLISMFDAWYTQVDDAPSNLWNGGSWKEALPVLKGVGEIHLSNDWLPSQAFSWMTPQLWNTPQMIRYGQSLAEPLSVVYCGDGMHRLAQHLGYNAQGFFCSLDKDITHADNILPEFKLAASNCNQTPFTPYYHMAYQKIYYDFYRDSEFEANVVGAYNIDSQMNQGFTNFCPQSATDPVFDMFKLRYRSKSKDYFTAIHPSPLFNGIGMLPNAQVNLSRVQNWLTAQAPDVLGNEFAENTSIGLFVPGSSPTGMEIVPDESADGVTTSSDLSRWTHSSKYGWFNDADVHTGDETKLQKNLAAVGENLSHDHFITSLDIANQLSLSGSSSESSSISLAQVRTAFALDKLLRITNRAGKHVDDQLLATFGVKIPQGVSGEVYKIKSYHTMFHIGEVIQSATTVDSSGADIPLGEMAGRGVAILNGNEKFKFTAPCHGILMTCFSIAPRYKYIFAQEKDGHKVYLEDFFRPQTDNLGMQPLAAYELGRETKDTTDQLMGWQYRYMEDKIKFDKATMVFATVGKNPWSFVTVAPRPVFNASDVRQGIAWQKIMPTDTNRMFVAQTPAAKQFPVPDSTLDGAPHSAAEYLSYYQYDQFTIDFQTNCQKVSQMSTYGEPSLGGI